MKSLHKYFWTILLNLALFSSSVFCQETKIKPVSPNASEETVTLLKFLYNISGKYILTGQHSYPNTQARNYYFAANYIGETPVVFSTDMGFAADGDTDSYLARADIVKKAVELHKLGVLITLCWHAVPPTADEPVTFRPLPGSNPDSLASVQGQLTDQQFKEILTPGTLLYKKWCAQVDSIAVYLKKIQQSHVPVLWRPYHEINGNWFWWNGRTGKYSSAKLYRQLFDRLVKFHKLNNLIWVWNVDRPVKAGMEFSDFYPGSDYLDVLSLDVYGNDYNQTYYDVLLSLSDGKPLALGEVGNPPSPEIFLSQPKWTYYATWAGMVRNTSRKNYEILVNNPYILNIEDSAYQAEIIPFRLVCGLPLLSVKQNEQVNFSGKWIFNEDKSSLDQYGAGNLPYNLEIEQKENFIIIKRTMITEFIDNKIEELLWTLDSKEIKSELWNAPMITTVGFSSDNDTLFVKTKVTFNWNDKTFEMLTNESWYLNIHGRELYIKQSSFSPWAKRNIVMVFDKQLFAVSPDNN